MAFSWYTSFSHTARSRTQGMLDPSQKTAGMHVIHLRFIGEGEIVAELRVLRRCEGAQQPLLRENLYGQAFPTGVFTAGSGFLCFRPWEFSCFRAIFLGYWWKKLKCMTLTPVCTSIRVLFGSLAKLHLRD
ncbi:uncharacterized protein LOC110094585 isoform X3 [Dendrobium catenatum]|uniref:uncharacterized protein LOC110094585 isoform X3 n=1 Tax=Dendrobium catenatum TaxID=906689 RepID=UPI0009F410CA|nr:uncharacterized protein LOC110094585 isoform X3 [Dendrobium catenatum]